MRPVEVIHASAAELARALRARDLSAVELVDFFLDRISTVNPAVNAFSHVAADHARGAAADADRRLADGDDAPFLGVPISVKDLANVAGMPTTRGVAAADGAIADTDDHVTALLRSAGFVILGKTNVPPLGLTCTTESGIAGPSRNPWALDRSTGGSSGGAAAAVAAGLGPVAHGSDGGGSLRTPAGACGVFTIKPTRGLVSNAPAPSSLTSTSGPLAWTVADAAALLDIMSIPAPGDAFVTHPTGSFAAATTVRPRRCRVALTTADADGAPVDRHARAAVLLAADALVDQGHHVEEAAPAGWASAHCIDVVLDLVTAGVAAGASRLPPEEALDPLTRSYLEHGRTVSGEAILRAQEEVGSWARRWAPFFGEYDVLLTPQNATPPPPLGWLISDPAPRAVLEKSWSFAPFTAQWNFAGNPVATVPIDTDDLGLPVAAQVVGRMGEEATLLQLAAQLEEALPWRSRRPPLTGAPAIPTV